MDAKTISAVCKQVYARFPEVNGAKPKVREQTENSYLLIFEGSGTAASGAAIRRTVRAVVTASGKITKLTTSR
jgi:polyphosphate kinase 2 (PPK2 family)